ncbi:hypothetical protein ABZ470_39810 [Streptosporangium sp. NPDC020072]|uniref:hypothetical protein n=1 Tax=Streptosporangium sp. NPDC020072 TaxID=3154788 RepID=UPI00342AB38A
MITVRYRGISPSELPATLPAALLIDGDRYDIYVNKKLIDPQLLGPLSKACTQVVAELAGNDPHQKPWKELTIVQTRGMHVTPRQLEVRPAGNGLEVKVPEHAVTPHLAATLSWIATQILHRFTPAAR